MHMTTYILYLVRNDTSSCCESYTSIKKLLDFKAKGVMFLHYIIDVKLLNFVSFQGWLVNF